MAPSFYQTKFILSPTLLIVCSLDHYLHFFFGTQHVSFTFLIDYNDKSNFVHTICRPNWKFLEQSNRTIDIKT